MAVKKTETKTTPKASPAKAMPEAKAAGPINRKMTLGEAVTKYPQTGAVMMGYGLHCIGCHVAAWESIEDGAKGHGLSEQEIDEMVADMNKAVKK
jgi:hybrid cluster-associated redox disulfide protein